MKIRTGLLGLGKMGISHLAIANSHPEIEISGVCDSNPILLGALRKNTDLHCYQNLSEMLSSERLEAIIIATPSRSHAELVKLALNHNLHVFCEKPFCLDPTDSMSLTKEMASRSLVGQVGYHFRFVGTFQKARELVRSNHLGRINHIRAEAYGPVVLRPRGKTWRTQRHEGGGCLYDYASHAIDLVNFIYDTPDRVSGTVKRSIFSRDVEDEVYSTLLFPSGATGQLAANWSDDSHRKMSVRLTIWGSNGRLSVDRQELQLHLKSPCGTYREGWHVENITQLTEPTSYYLRGEEYSAQIDHFVQCIAGKAECRSSFMTASSADSVINMIVEDAQGNCHADELQTTAVPAASRTFFHALSNRISARS
ncbi:Gfo/Idh/MocA family protein [Microvirga rosea]|uniref:Gfo/Idh/MocA family protein n=1 Tax=Microvirga rosea TaxID=2715425 RepID=UPI001D0A1916|nr:Gfo/Idh/MocA family oxidoreductase [Microvirga rosea]MCB8818929.1 Gfo/Idh/MocA family oxidoreductase [Microvirga rosea]